jgi:hypothetical protein
MSTSIQLILDSVQQHMENAQQQIYSGPAGTRALQALVTMLSKRYITKEQQQQIEAILNVHENCLPSEWRTETTEQTDRPELVTRACLFTSGVVSFRS